MPASSPTSLRAAARRAVKAVLPRRAVPSDLLVEHHRLNEFYNKVVDLGLTHLFMPEAEPEGWAASMRFSRPGHFYSPIPLQSEIEARYDEVINAEFAAPGIDLRADAQIALFKELASYGREWPFPEEKTDGFRYFSGPGNFAFGIGDGLMLFSMLRHLRPRRLIEVGSGFSSALTLDTNERYLDGATQMTFIEPYPELLHSLVGEHPDGVEIIDQPVQSVATSTFASLEHGDVLFLDTTHVSRFGSDVNDVFARVLPAVAPGVVVHLHDIFWPFEYPLGWLREGRAWNETYLLRSFLQYNDHFEILLFNSYLDREHPELVARELPQMSGQAGASLWLRRVR